MPRQEKGDVQKGEDPRGAGPGLILRSGSKSQGLEGKSC